YDALFVNRTKDVGNVLGAFDLAVVDGGVNAVGWSTRMSGEVSKLWDKWVIDGLVNVVGFGTKVLSYPVRVVQTGLVQTYAWLIVSLFIRGENKSAVRWWANIVMFVSFLVSLPLVVWFTHEAPDQQFKFIEDHLWIASIGAHYHLGIDGISFLLIMLTTVLGFLSVLSSWTAIEDRPKEYYAMFMLLQVGMLGVFM